MVPTTDKLEAETRKEIDIKLEAASCDIEDKKAVNLYAGEQGIHGVAICEMDTDPGIDIKLLEVVMFMRDAESPARPIRPEKLNFTHGNIRCAMRFLRDIGT